MGQYVRIGDCCELDGKSSFLESLRDEEIPTCTDGLSGALAVELASLPAYLRRGIDALQASRLLNFKPFERKPYAPLPVSQGIVARRNVIRMLPVMRRLSANSAKDVDDNYWTLDAEGKRQRNADFNPCLALRSPLHLEWAVAQGAYFSRRIGTAAYLNMFEFENPDSWMTPAERQWRTAALHFRAAYDKILEGRPAYNGKKYTPKPVKAAAPQHPKLDLLLFGPEASVYNPKAPTIKNLERPHANIAGDPAHVRQWIKRELVYDAWEKACWYADVLQEDRLALRQSLTNHDFMGPYLTDALGQHVHMERLLTKERHEANLAQMMKEWQEDADAWRGSALQLLFPDNFRLVF